MEQMVIEKDMPDGGHCKLIIVNPERLEAALDRVRRAHWDRIKPQDENAEFFEQFIARKKSK